MHGHRLGLLSLTLILAVGTGVMAQEAGNADKGKSIFNRCKACHTFDESGKSRMGPNLYGVVGRKAATYPGYNYSPAMKKAGADGMVWTSAELDIYLVNPQKLVPHTKMSFPGIKNDQERADVIAYLSEASKAPAAK